MFLFEDPSSNSFFSFRGGEGVGEGLNAYCKWVAQNLTTGKLKQNSKQYKELIKDVSDFMYVRFLYSCLRKTWHPGTGCGSQGSELKMSAMYYENLAKIARNSDKKIKEEYESYE